MCWLGLGLRFVLARTLRVLFYQSSWLLGNNGTKFGSASGSDILDPRILIYSYIHLCNLWIEMLVSNLLLLIRVTFVSNAVLLTWNIYHTLIFRSIYNTFRCIWMAFFIWITFLPRFLNDHYLLLRVHNPRHLLLLQDHIVLVISALVNVSRRCWVVELCLCYNCCRFPIIVSV